MDLKSILVKCILKTLLECNDGFCFVMDFPSELFILVKRSPGLYLVSADHFPVKKIQTCAPSVCVMDSSDKYENMHATGLLYNCTYQKYEEISVENVAIYWEILN